MIFQSVQSDPIRHPIRDLKVSLLTSDFCIVPLGLFLVFLDCISRIYGLYFLYLWIVSLTCADVQHAVAHGVLADSPPHPHPNLERQTWLYGVCISFFNNNNVIKCMGFVFNLSTIIMLLNVWGLYLVCQQF